jgi:BlaR1 peptidase M56/Surface antigen variable number repeat
VERLFFEFAFRAVLVVGAAAIVLSAMRVKSATARHSVWAGVVAMMMLLPIWTAWGPRLPMRVLPPLAQNTANKIVPPADFLSTGMRVSHQVSLALTVFMGCYLSGLCLLLLRLAVGTLRARMLVRNASLHDGVRTSSACSAPVTVGFFHPTVILPQYWRQWPQDQLDAVLTHESEHARRRHSLVQWLALLNRALFWFHPVAWWLERHLSNLAEEACDNAVLARGHDPRAYSEYLIGMARSVERSGARLNIAGIAMPGSSLPRRIRLILEGGSAAHISRVRMACVGVACAIACTAFAAGRLDHARSDSSAERAMIQGEAASAHPATKFLLGDVQIKGDVHDRDGVRDRVLKVWKDHREYDDDKELVDEVMEVGIRQDFMKRGYFKVVVQDPVSQPLGLVDGKQRIRIMATVTEGEQFRLGSLTIQNVAPDQPLSIPAATLQEQFHIRKDDLFDVSEIRAGLEGMQRLYGTHGYAKFTAEPETKIDTTSRHIDLIIRVTEGPQSARFVN